MVESVLAVQQLLDKVTAAVLVELTLATMRVLAVVVQEQ
jgi:hypothetical protein